MKMAMMMVKKKMVVLMKMMVEWMALVSRANQSSQVKLFCLFFTFTSAHCTVSSINDFVWMQSKMLISF